SPETCRQMFDLNEREATRLLDLWRGLDGRNGPEGLAAQMRRGEEQQRFPLLKVFEYCLKCSHLFNILDARGAVSVTERVALIGRVRKLACRVAAIDVDRKTRALEEAVTA
ncbi:MAG: glycine--tRNA ligase subunit alpha, partial [Terriglobia bacterium]